MNMIVKIFLSMSFSGSLFILMLFTVKYFLKNIISRRWQYYIWLIVIVRLLLPIVPEINLMEKFFTTINNTVVKSNAILPQKQEQVNEQEFSYITDINLKSNKQEITEMTKYFNNIHIIKNIFSFLLNKILLIWIIIALILFVRKVTIYQSFIKYINLELKPVSDTKLLDRFFIIAKQLGIKRPIELCVNPLISSPLLIGFFRPYIILPCTNISEKDFSYIILHELIHYKRRDIFYKWLVQITICLHWFNPFVYFMVKEINKACEFSCDESVVIKVGYSKAQEYGKTLLDAMASVGKYKESFGTVTLSENKKLLKERLGAIMNFRKKSKLATIMTIILTLCIIFGIFSIGIYPISAKSIDYKSNDIVNKSNDDIISSIYRYTQDGYYEYPYIFEIGWNVQENNNIFYTTKTLTLNTGEQLTVYFSDECKTIMNDEKVIKVLISLLTNLYSKTKTSDFPMIRPLIISTQYIQDNDITDMAEKYYKEESLPRFGAVFSKLNETMQREWLNIIYTDDKIAFFSVSLNHISSDSPLIEEFAEKTYYDGDIAFFSVLTNYMNKETLKLWLVKAKSDKKINFQSILLKATDNEQELKDMEIELEQKLIDEYKAYGIIKSGKSYYYKNELVNVFMDVRKDSSFYTLDMNPLGIVNIRVMRNETGKIQSINYMTKDEVTELFDDESLEDYEYDLEDKNYNLENLDNSEINSSIENIKNNNKEQIKQNYVDNLSTFLINSQQWNSSEVQAIEMYYKTDRIFILPSTTNQVILKEYLTENKPHYYASTKIKNNVLSIYSGDRPTNNYSSYIEIYIPKEILFNAKVNTLSGEIRVNDYAGVLDLSTVSGKIRIFNSVIGGNINTNSGTVEIMYSDLLGDLYSNTKSGKILVNYTNDASFNLRLKTVNGKIINNCSNNQSLNKKEVSEVIGNTPTFTMSLKTISSNIEISNK